MTLGKKVRKLRTAAKISLRQLSEVVGVSSSQLSRIERDMDSPRANTLLKIAEFFDVKMEQLLKVEAVIDPSTLQWAQADVASVIENIERHHPVIVTEIKIVRTAEGNNLAGIYFSYEEKE